jgi:hypothetical protein
MALPFLTLLAPSKRFYAAKLRASTTLVDWARQATLQIRRGLPDRTIVLVDEVLLRLLNSSPQYVDHACVAAPRPRRNSTA